MKKLLIEFLSLIVEAPKKKPATPSDNPNLPPEARGKYTKGRGLYYADPEFKQYVGKISKGKWIPAGASAPSKSKKASPVAATKPKAKSVSPAASPAATKKTGVGKATTGRAKQEPPVSATKPSTTPTTGKSKAPSTGVAITADMVNPKTSSEDMVTQLEASNQKLLEQRKKGVPGPGGAVASYGEIALCEFTNELSRVGISGFRKQNAAAIRKELNTLNKITDKRQKTVLDRRIKVLADELGLDAEQDREIVINYLATRRAYENLEIERLKADKPDGVFYLSSGFNQNEEAARLWAQAQFDGGIATLDLISESTIDTSKPFTVIQSEARARGQDQAILSHLELEMEKAKKNKDVESENHYSKQISAWAALGFHDTMAVGQDSNGRLTVFHVTNKKQNDLIDIWNNTSPTEAIDAFRRSYLAKQAGETQEISDQVFKALDLGTKAAAANAGDMGDVLVDMEMDDEVATVMHAVESGKLKGRGGPKQYLGPIIGKRPFQAWLKTRPDVVSSLKQTEKSKGIDRTKAQLLAIQSYAKDLKAAGKKIPAELTRILTKVAEETSKTEKVLGVKLDSTGVQSCRDVKEREKDLMGAIHTKVATAILESDKGFPDAEGNNGPHTQTYIGTVMHAMHFDIMVKNYDENLAAVTGVRGSTPNDFRVCLAELSGFQSDDLNNPEERMRLNDHLMKRSRLNPTTRAIEITNESGTHVLAEDSWRTSGLSKKVEKKLGESIRMCVMKQADTRRRTRREKTISEFS